MPGQPEPGFFQPIVGWFKAGAIAQPQIDYAAFMIFSAGSEWPAKNRRYKAKLADGAFGLLGQDHLNFAVRPWNNMY